MVYLRRLTNEFDPEKQHAFKHFISEHPLFQFDELKKLALRNKNIRFHSANLLRSQRFDTARDEHKTNLSLKETLENINSSGSFVYIKEVEKDPVYGPFVNELFKELQLDILKFSKKIIRPQAWIFITSPGGVTPYHRDFEANHFFQIKGDKTLWLWDPKNKEVITQEEDEHFHAAHSLEKTIFYENKIDKATVHKLEASDGVFFPYTAPHMLENGSNEYSISLSITHLVPEYYKMKRLNKINYILRKYGINPSPIESSKIKDTLKLSAHWFLRNVLFIFSKDWKDS